MMNSPNTIQSNVSPRGEFHLGLQTAPAWAAILGLVIFTIVGILAGGGFLRIAFPLASFIVGLFLYKRYPVLYMGFTWWLWFLTPLVRRLVDFKSGFVLVNLIMVTPYLITLITVPRLIQYFLRAYPYRQGGLPFIIVLVAICYSFLIGLINLGFNFAIVRTFAEWIGPVSFGFFIFSNWRNYPSYKENTQRTFLWGTLVMGSYGIIQFLAMPAWDSYWAKQAAEEVGFTMGLATDYGTAIWSTTNSNGMLATFLVPGILILFNSKSPLRIPILGVGGLVLLLTNARTSWILGLLALLILIGSMRSNLQIRIIPIVLAVLLSVFTLSNIQPFAGMINNRIGSLSSLQEDGSVNARKHLYEKFWQEIPNRPIGCGLSCMNDADSAIINLGVEMGWYGSLIFYSGWMLLLWQLFQNSRANYDVFQLVARAVAFSLAISPSGNVYAAQPAFVIWFFASICMAGHIYDRHQLTNHNA